MILNINKGYFSKPIFRLAVVAMVVFFLINYIPTIGKQSITIRCPTLEKCYNPVYWCQNDAKFNLEYLDLCTEIKKHDFPDSVSKKTILEPEEVIKIGLNKEKITNEMLTGYAIILLLAFIINHIVYIVGGLIRK